MSKDVNNVTLLGRLGSDPEIKVTDGGRPRTTFRVATKRTWKGGDGAKQEKTEWHRCVAWAGLAEIVGEYCRKGSRVYVEGHLDTRAWQDGDETRYITEIVVDEVILLDTPQQTRAAPHGAANGIDSDDPLD